MKQYNVTGMSCAACSARVEKAVANVEGVEACSVSLLTNSMGVEGTADEEEIIAAVVHAGYGATAKGGNGEARQGEGLFSQEEAALEDRETPILKKRLVTSLGFLVILMYFSMGHTMWGWPVPEFFHKNILALGLLQLLLAATVMIINNKFFTSGFRSLFHGAPNMDTLVALGSAAAFGWSTVSLFAMTREAMVGNYQAVMAYGHNLYFESAAMIVTLITIGKMLEARSKGKTTDALKSLMKLAPQKATLLVDGMEKAVNIEDVHEGDMVAIKPGENIPVDGIVVEGGSAVNEAALTGESIPVDKDPGDMVSAATVNQSGYIICRTTKVGEDTALAQIIRMVSDAAATKAPIAKIADTVSGVFVPAVMAAALITVVVWLLVGQSAGFALARGIAVLVVSCPCALGLATPVAIMVGNGVGAKSGILFKTAESQETTGKVAVVAVDKTGTITQGEPKVTDIFPAEGIDREDLLVAATALEQHSEHPLAKAVMQLAEEEDIAAYAVDGFEILPGNGLKTVLDGMELAGGNLSFIESIGNVPETLKRQADTLAEEGKTCLYFAAGNQVVGMIAVADVMKKDSPKAIAQIKAMGIKVVMVTGDNEKTAKAIGKAAGVDQVIAGVLPDGKEKVVRDLQKTGRVAMVGDGINDAPALTRADVGIAVGAGTDVAIDAADVVVMKSRLSDVTAAIGLSRTTLRNIHQNLFWAFFYNVCLIPLAAGAYFHLFGWTMNPMVGAAAMSLSSFCVVMNALRLNFFPMGKPEKYPGHNVKGK